MWMLQDVVDNDALPGRGGRPARADANADFQSIDRGVVKIRQAWSDTLAETFALAIQQQDAANHVGFELLHPAHNAFEYVLERSASGQQLQRLAAKLFILLGQFALGDIATNAQCPDNLPVAIVLGNVAHMVEAHFAAGVWYLEFQFAGNPRRDGPLDYALMGGCCVVAGKGFGKRFSQYRQEFRRDVGHHRRIHIYRPCMQVVANQIGRHVFRQSAEFPFALPQNAVVAFALQFGSGTGRDELQDLRDLRFVAQGFAIQHGNHAYRMADRVPQREAGVTFGAHCYQQLSSGEHLLHPLRIETESPPHDVFAWRALDNVVHVRSDNTIGIRRNRLRDARVFGESADEDIIHAQGLAQVFHQRVEEVLGAIHPSALRYKVQSIL